MMPMISMEYDDEDMEEMELPLPLSERARYPYGLKICLTDKEMRKLGIDPMEAFMGGVVHAHVSMRITSVSMNETENGHCSRLEFQIEEMAIPELEEETPRRRSPLYDRD